MMLCSTLGYYRDSPLANRLSPDVALVTRTMKNAFLSFINYLIQFLVLSYINRKQTHALEPSPQDNTEYLDWAVTVPTGVRDSISLTQDATNTRHLSLPSQNLTVLFSSICSFFALMNNTLKNSWGKGAGKTTLVSSIHKTLSSDPQHLQKSQARRGRKDVPAVSALVEDLSSVPNTQVGWFKTTCNSNSKEI